MNHSSIQSRLFEVPQSLQEFFAVHPRVAIAFSGGVDSVYLLYAAVACGCEVCAYYVSTQFQPAFELQDAKRAAQEIGSPLKIIELDALASETVRQNPANRCYYCKKVIFGTILAAAATDGFCVLVDGTNASDDAADRPGMQALRELQVLSPLQSCGIEKSQIRALSREAGLFTWDKPAYACLATRVPTGTPLTAKTLLAVEKAESALHAMGFSDLRVRTCGTQAKLQLPADQMQKALLNRNKILQKLSGDFTEVVLDLKSR